MIVFDLSLHFNQSWLARESMPSVSASVGWHCLKHKRPPNFTLPRHYAAVAAFAGLLTATAVPCALMFCMPGASGILPSHLPV